MFKKFQTQKYSAIFILFLFLIQSPFSLWETGSLVLCYAADDHVEIEYLLNNKCFKSSASISTVDCCTSLVPNLSSINFDQSPCLDIPISVSAERHTGRNSTQEVKIPAADSSFSSLLPDVKSFCKTSLFSFTTFPQNQTLVSITSTILII
jgi:hypothetical protein